MSGENGAIVGGFCDEVAFLSLQGRCTDLSSLLKRIEYGRQGSFCKTFVISDPTISAPIRKEALISALAI